MKKLSVLPLLLLSMTINGQVLFNNHYLNNNNEKRENLPLKNVIVNHYDKYIVLGHQADRNSLPIDFAKTVLTFINSNGGTSNALEISVNDTVDLNGQCFAASSSEEYIVAGSANAGASQRSMAFKINANGSILWSYYYDGIEFRQIEYLHTDDIGNRYFVMTGVYKDTSNIDRLMAVKIDQNGNVAWAFHYYPIGNPSWSSEVPKSVIVERNLITIAGTRTNNGNEDVFRFQIDWNGNILSTLLNFDYGYNEKEPFLKKYKTGYLFSFTAEDRIADTLLKEKHAIAKFRNDWNLHWTRLYSDTVSRHHTANAIHEIVYPQTFVTAGTNHIKDSLMVPYYFATDTNGIILYQAQYPDSFAKSTSYFMPVDTGFVLHALDHYVPLMHKFNLITLNIAGNTVCNENPHFSSVLTYPEIGEIEFMKDTIRPPDSLYLEVRSPYTNVLDCLNDSVHKTITTNPSNDLKLINTNDSYIIFEFSADESQIIHIELFDIIGRKLDGFDLPMSSGTSEIKLPIYRNNQVVIIRSIFKKETKTFKLFH